MAPPAKRKKPASTSASTSKVPSKRQKTTSSSAGAASSPKDKLYDACLRDGGIEKTWTIEMLMALGIAADHRELMTRCQELMKAELFQPVEAGATQGAAFGLRSRAAARKYSLLADSDAVEVFRHVEHAGIQGIWKLTLKKRTGIHENKIDKLLKGLCSSKHIKQLKGARSGAKKTYILYDLQPAKEVTGGAWYSDGDLDVEFIDLVANLAIHYVKLQSWMAGPKLPNARLNPRQGKASGADSDDPAYLRSDESEAELRMRVATDSKNRILLPQPPQYDAYPTASEVLDKIISTGFVRDKSITLDDMQDLFSRLVYDGRIERVGTRSRKGNVDADMSDPGDDHDDSEDDDNENDEPVYRWVKRPDAWKPQDARNEDEVDFTATGWNANLGPGNGFSEAPCSKCPVIALCDEGGPVEAKRCAYYDDWF